MKSTISIYVTICFLIMLLQGDFVTYAEDINENDLYSISAVLIDGDNGRVLYGKNENEIRAMASTTKIMTLILALEYSNKDDLVTVSSYASKMPDVQLGICEGEQYKMSDLMYSLMLESHNDSAVAIAEHVGGSVEEFADMMNKKAREIGLEDTYFITPNGLDGEDDFGKHSTTAKELARLMKYCIVDSPKKEEFISICQTRNHSFTDYEGKKNYTVNNKNAFLDMMDGVIAGKTGFTADAGYCYVGAVRRDNKTYIVALLGCGWPRNKSYKWSDAKKLINHGIDSYNYEYIIDTSYASKDVPVTNGVKDYVFTYIKDEVGLLVSDTDKIKIERIYYDNIMAPVERGDKVGHLNIYINDELNSTVNVYASEDIENIDFKYCLKYIGKKFLF